MTLLFAVLTKNAFIQKLHIRMRKYTTSAHGHELSGCVCADTCNLIFALYYYVPWPCAVLCVIRERQVILKAAFHSRLAF